jgi:thiol:disulfide interchange protein DsbD
LPAPQPEEVWRIIFAANRKTQTHFYMIKLLSLSLALFAALTATAQSNPVKWTYEAKKVSDDAYDLVFTAQIQDGWYVYSQYLETDDGPIRTSFNYDANLALEFQGKNKEEGRRYEGYDDLFGMNIIKFSGTPTFTQRVRVKSATTLTGYLEFMTCDEEKCLPPVSQTFSFSLPQ